MNALAAHPAISFAIPVYNERESIEELWRRISAVMAARNEPYDVVFVDDGSTDGSWEVIERIAAGDARVHGVKLRRNFGKSEALAAAFEAAHGDIVFTLDADLQDDPAEVPQFLEKLNEGYDVVSGWKRERHDPLEKRLPSKLFNAVTSFASGVLLHDFNCGFKCYRAAVLAEICIYGERHRFIPVLAHQRGYKVTEIPVRHHARQHGTSKFGVERYLRGMIDLITLSFLGAFERRPAHLFGGLGILLVVLGGVVDLYMLYVKIVYGQINPHYPLLFLGVLLTIVGVQFVTFGLLSELMLIRSQRTTAASYSVGRH